MTNERMKKIQIIADNFRQDCRELNYGLADIFDECDRKGFQLVRYPIGDNGVLGFAQIRAGDKIIFSNSSARLAREIFSVAHELGHMQLHMNRSGGNCSFVDDLQTFSGYHADEREKEANYFAACLLMPEDKVYKYISMEMQEGKPWTARDIARMMTAFGVSFEMALNRLQNLGKIGGQERTQIDNQKNQQKVAKLLLMTGGNGKLNTSSHEKRIPQKYMDWVITNYNKGVIPEETLKTALQYFDVTPEDISDELHPAQTVFEDDLDELIGGMDD